MTAQTTHGEALTEQQADFIDGLEALTAFLVKNPACIPDYGGCYVSRWVSSDIESQYAEKVDDEGNFTGYDYKTATNADAQDADVRRQLARLASAMKPCKKDYAGGMFQVVREFGPHTLTMQASRSAVCERVVTGTKTELVPDPEAPKVERTVDVVEWHCGTAILNA